MPLCSSLRWLDLAPSTHQYDESVARQLVTDALVTAAPRSLDTKPGIVAEIDRALMAEFGAWIDGWAWVSDDDGGPVRALNAPIDDCIVLSGDSAGERVLRAIGEWRDFLVTLESLFSELPHHQGQLGEEIERDIAQAAARLLPIVVERTVTYNMWYWTFARSISWYLDSRGHDPDVTDELIGSIVQDNFQSWVVPDDSVVTSTIATLSARIVEKEADEVHVVAAVRRGGTPWSATASGDSLNDWQAIRVSAFTLRPPTAPPFLRTPLRHDGHRRFINTVERFRDPERADAMDVALDMCRASAASNTLLTFNVLAEWQAVVLGLKSAPAAFRTTEAFAKRGRERYGIKADTAARFEGCLAETSDESIPVATRAARVYLDVCFFHPFADGNARAARLALDHVLTRAGLGLECAEPIFVIPRIANDKYGASALGYLVETLLGEA